MNISILGHTGRVGKILAAELQSGAWPEMTYAGGAGLGDDPAALFTAADVLIDFTSPEATRRHIWLAAKHHKPLVIGTTGLTAADEKKLESAAKETAILYTANMSVGVNILLSLVEQAAAKLGAEWDIEIAETHHKNKVDAPSGTALALGRAAQKGRASGAFVTDRTGKRNAGDIGYAVQRGGDVVGEHTVTFYGAGERISLGHIATDRTLFVRGALRAAQWLGRQNRPGLYTMRDALGL
jgi:4-hydroxy-tetrahydrodipicolinate reductase